MEFDPAKNLANIAKHGLNFVGAEAIFDGETYTYEDRSADYGEARTNSIGMLDGQVVCFTYTTDGDDVRAISLRPATPNEIRRYARYLQGH